MHAFVTSRIDYCNAIYAGALKTIIDKLQRVLNAAARVVSDTKKFDRGLSTLQYDKLHWLDVPERVTFKLGLMTYQCLHGHWTSTSVSCRSHHPSHRSRISTSTTFYQSTPAHCTTLSTQHVQPSGFSSCWSDGLELTAKWTQASNVWYWQFHTILQNNLVSPPENNSFRKDLCFTHDVF